MNQTQSIIVYRNPMEQQFWEGDGIMIFLAILFAGFVFFIGAVVGDKIETKVMKRKKWNSQVPTYTGVVFALVYFCFLYFKFF